MAAAKAAYMSKNFSEPGKSNLPGFFYSLYLTNSFSDHEARPVMMTSLEIFVLQTKRAPSFPAPLDDALAEAILALAGAAKEIADLASYQGIGGASLGTLTGQENEDGDDQKQLDVMADDLIQRAIQQTDIGLYFSEEMSTSLEINKTGALGLACDPLDGSSNIDTNLTIGTIFSIFKKMIARQVCLRLGELSLRQACLFTDRKLVFYFALAMSLPPLRWIRQVSFTSLTGRLIPKASHEFAINASNAAFGLCLSKAISMDFAQVSRPKNLA